MNTNLNYNATIGKRHEPYKQRNPLNKLNPINRNQMDRIIPCRPVFDPIIVIPAPSPDREMVPNLGHTRGSSNGLARSKLHPTNLPLL